MYFVPKKETILSRSIEDYPDGIVLCIDKPYRWTSADVIRKVKYNAIRHFGKKNLKVGHAGTLDPLATGILLVCIGNATKLAESFQKGRKQYVAGISFGATTPSYDLEKAIDRTYPLDGVSEESIKAVLPQFLGSQMQVAPLFSAKSVDGVRAYETARKLFKQGKMEQGEGIIRANRIEIDKLELLSFTDSPIDNSAESGKEGRINVADISAATLKTAMVQVDCSKGTYIRSLARDMGEALGSGAFLSSLRRTGCSGFTIDDALPLDVEMECLNKWDTIL